MKNNKAVIFVALLCGLLILFNTFLYFPIMGHDYSLMIPSAMDLRVSWAKFGVLNPHFSSQKCLGVPLWSNPTGFNFSFMHILLLFMNDLPAFVVLILVISILSFYGSYQLCRKFKLKKIYAIYLAAGWTLQGAIIIRTMVGHVAYSCLGLLPLLIILYFKKENKFKNTFSTICFALICAHYVFFPAPYLIIVFIFSAFLMCPLLYFWEQDIFKNVDWRYYIIKSLCIICLLLIVLAPKLLSVHDLMINFPREMSMATPGLFKVLPLAALNVFSAIPLNFKYQIGWQYGNWESIQFIYPGYFLVFFYALARNKKEIIFKRLYLSVFYLIIVSAILMSGIFSNIFSMIPVLKSMHVNPRWAMVVIFPLFYLAIKCCQEFELNEAWVKILLVFVFLVPLLYLDKVNLALDYPYRAGYDETNNKLGYCYEPFYGYNLEYFPVPRNTQVDFFRNKYLDPRCLLASGNCKPGTLLPDNDIDALEKYQLK